MSKTKIEYCDITWNPVWGCKGTGCPYCYARNKVFPMSKYAKTHNFNEPFFIPDNYHKKFAKNTQRVFVNSMSDIMYWTPEWWERVIDRISENPEIDFIFLTKGGWEVYHNTGLSYPYNCILGITVTGGENLETMVHPTYREMNCKWLLNIEPLLTPIPMLPFTKLLHGYEWIIIGAESGGIKGRTPVRAMYSMIEDIVTYAITVKKPLFIKPSLEDVVPEEQYVQQYPHLAWMGEGWLHD